MFSELEIEVTPDIASDYFSANQEYAIEEETNNSMELDTKFAIEKIAKQMGTKKHLINNKNTHTNRYDKELCKICNKNVSKTFLVRHQKKVHPDHSIELLTKISQDIAKTEENIKKKIHTCRMCVFESLDFDLVQKHINETQHHGNLEKQEVPCPYCEYKGSSLHRVKVHIDNKHQDHGEKNYFCDQCNKGFFFETSYNEHSHTKNKKQPTRWCEICDIKVVSLASHIVDKHESNGQIICSYCDYRTKPSEYGLGTLIYHIDTKHPEHGEKKFFCNICTKSFIFKSNFSSHLGMHKSNQKEHICEICGQKYVKVISLKHHMLEFHPLPDATNFVCDTCGFSTVSDWKLKRHRRLKHEVEKHKQCPYCEYRANTNQRLNLHIDRKHPEHGEKQFFCEICGKGFIFKASLHDHPLYYCPKNPKFRGNPNSRHKPKPNLD